jgi:NADH:ubiquinone oxidoreductase subunit E
MTQAPAPETSPAPLAPGQRLPESPRRDLSPAALAEIQALAVRYPSRMAATLPALYVAQREFGFLSLGAMRAVAQALELPETHVFGVATFYTMFLKRPVGKFHLQVCTNLSCALLGGARLLEKVCERTGVEPGGPPSADGLWSVEEVECLGSCGSGPCAQVNHEVYDEFLDEAALEKVLEACRSGQIQPWGEE